LGCHRRVEGGVGEGQRRVAYARELDVRPLREREHLIAEVDTGCSAPQPDEIGDLSDQVSRPAPHIENVLAWARREQIDHTVALRSHLRRLAQLLNSTRGLLVVADHVAHRIDYEPAPDPAGSNPREIKPGDRDEPFREAQPPWLLRTRRGGRGHSRYP
jgi:hypothetical protein